MQKNHVQTLAQIDDQVEKFKKKYKMEEIKLPTGVSLIAQSQPIFPNFMQNTSSSTTANTAVEELENDRNNFSEIGDSLEKIKIDVQDKKPKNIDELMQVIEKLEVDVAALKERNLELKRELELLILHQKKEQERDALKNENDQLHEKILKIREGAKSVKSDINQSISESEIDKKRVNITYNQELEHSKKMEKKLDYKDDGHTL